MFANELSMLVMLGVTNSTAMVSATKAFEKLGKLTRTTDREAFEEALKKLFPTLPPEGQAMALVHIMDSLYTLISESDILAKNFGMFGHEPLREARKAYLLAVLDALESICVQVRDACADRAADGWPEWDYNAEHVKPVNLSNLLDGLDLSWLSEEAG